MQDSLYFITPSPHTAIKPQLSSSERKLNLLENRMTGPSKDGLSPIESNKFLTNDMDNLKIKLFNITQNAHESTKSSTHNTFNMSSCNSNSIKKDESAFNYLNSKRKRPPSSEGNTPLQKSSGLTGNKAKGKGRKDAKLLANNSKLNDYYKINNTNEKASLSLSASSLKNVSTSSSLLPMSPVSYIETTHDSAGSIDDKVQSLMMEKDRIIKEKDKEIDALKLIIEEYKEMTDALNNYNKSYIEEIEVCQRDIIQFIKQVSELNRQKIKRDINDKQYTLGRCDFQKISNGQILEYWEDGEELKRITQRYNQIVKDKTDLQQIIESNNDKDNESNNQMLLFKLHCLNREEAEMKISKETILQQKTMLVHTINLMKEESKCTYKNNWALLGNRYQLISLLGKGGYSEVYKAYDIKTHKYVACKVHQLNQNWKEEIKDNYIKHTMREDEILKGISHQNIVTHYDTIMIDNNSFCSILELCSGPDLGTYIKERKYLTEVEAKAIIYQVLKALEYLSQLNKKIIHYDIKPQNIIFNKNMEEIKVTDFGLAKIVEDNQTDIELTSQGVGTYYYLPPECFIRGSEVKINNKVDIWSIGIVLYEMLYGIKPFGHNYSQDKLISENIISNINGKSITFNDDINLISNDCKFFIRKCLEFHPDKRYDIVYALDSKFIHSDL